MAKKSEKTEKQAETQEKKVQDSKKEVQEEAVNQAEETSKEEEVEQEATEEKSNEAVLEVKLADIQDKYIRLSAEFDNYRKRTLKEKIDLQDSVKSDIFKSILPVVDDLERALGSIETAKDLKAVKEGMTLIYGKFGSYLEQQGVKEIKAMGKELDTDVHEAITKIPVDSKKKKGKIVDVVEKGYVLKEKVIRFAKVVIGE